MRTTNGGRRRTRSTLLAALVAATLTLAGCAGGTAADPSGAAAESEPISGGTARIASFSEMPGFDPVKLANVGTGIERAAAVMDTLLVRDELTDEVTPKLAEGIDSADGKTWVLTLREGVTFTDGEPLNAEAVIFNLDRHIAPDSTSAAKSLLAGIESMEATGEYEVTITLSEPNGSFPLALTGSSPASLIGSPKALADPDTFNSNPVGAGPFVFESWTRDDTLTLSRNDDYWDEGKPYLDGVEFVIMTDGQTRADGLMSGSLDVGLVQGFNWSVVGADPNLTLTPAPTGGQALIFNETSGPGADIRVRQAASMAFDPTVTAQVLFGGTEFWGGDTSCLPWAEGSPACAEGTVNAQDVEEAKRLVAEYIADGGDPSVELVHYQTYTQHATYYQEQLNAIGLDVTLRSVDAATLAEVQSTGDYGILVGATASAGFPTVWNRYYSGGSNWGKGDHPDLDAALIEARDALELEDRNAAWREVAQILHDEAILFWTTPYVAGVANRNVIHLGTADDPYDGSTMIYLDSVWKDAS